MNRTCKIKIKKITANMLNNSISDFSKPVMEAGINRMTESYTVLLIPGNAGLLYFYIFNFFDQFGDPDLLLLNFHLQGYIFRLHAAGYFTGFFPGFTGILFNVFIVFTDILFKPFDLAGYPGSFGSVKIN